MRPARQSGGKASSPSHCLTCQAPFGGRTIRPPSGPSGSEKAMQLCLSDLLLQAPVVEALR